jgi:hypothetical protein
MRTIIGLLFVGLCVCGQGYAAEADCKPQAVTITGFARATLGIFAADGTFTDKEIATGPLAASAITVCDWNRERNLMRLKFADRDIWVDPAELQLKLGDKPQDAGKVACADAPSKRTGTQTLASMGVGGQNCEQQPKPRG